MGNKNITEFPHILNTCVSTDFNKALWGVLWPTAKKKNPTKPRVKNTMVKVFFLIFRISICKTLPLILWTFQLIGFFM